MDATVKILHSTLLKHHSPQILTTSELLRVLSILLRGFYFNEFPKSHLKIKKWERMRRNESSGLTQVRLSGTVTVKTLTFQETNLG